MGDPPEIFPAHFHVAEMLKQDSSGSVPYADVAFDVGPDGGGASAGRFLAHRIIVAAQSTVLFEALEKLPLTPLTREGITAAIIRVDARISKEVWRCVLQFMYTGHINCSFSSDVVKIVEMLRACITYKLPMPLLEFAQYQLYPLLPSSPPQIALQVFSLCTGAAATNADLAPAREASTYILLRSAHKIVEAMEPKHACQILDRLVQTVENAIFNPRPKPAPAKANGYPLKQQEMQRAQLQQAQEQQQQSQQMQQQQQ